MTRVVKDYKRNKYLILMLLPVLAYYFVFAYTPMYGTLIAFQDFSARLGVWGSQWLVAVIASISIIITAAYIMRNIRQVFFMPMPEALKEHHITDITMLDKVAITTLCLFMIGLGMFPAIMLPMIETGVQNILRLLGVA